MHLHHSQGTNRAQAKMSRVFSEESSESSATKTSIHRYLCNRPAELLRWLNLGELSRLPVVTIRLVSLVQKTMKAVVKAKAEPDCGSKKFLSLKSTATTCSFAF
jgi:hypothetical protein